MLTSVDGNLSFAEKQMRKYGWEKGKGLGANENGIAEPIKVKIKTDSTGVGHDQAETFTYHWWDQCFKNAASNIKIEENNNSVTISAKGESKNASTSKYLNSSDSKKNKMYGRFLKSGILDNGVVTKDSSDSDSSDDDDNKPSIPMLTDEQLFKACGGRTAHKGARHGLKLSGKLARLEAQEMKKLKAKTDSQKVESLKVESQKVENVGISPAVVDDENSTEKPLKKKKKKKAKEEVEEEDSLKRKLDSTENQELPKKKKKKSKKNKEVVTIATAKADETNENESIKKKKKKKKKTTTVDSKSGS